jgi:hypothetical protein
MNPKGPAATPSQGPSAPIAVATSSPSPTADAGASPAATPSEGSPEPTSASSGGIGSVPAPLIVRKTGRGDRVLRFPAQDAPTVARISGTGRGNFAVVSYAGAEYGDLLVNEIGSYAGWVYVAAGINRFKITSSGSWTVEIRSITSARAWDGARAMAGKGDQVILLSRAAAGSTTIKNKGHSNFAVTAYSPEGDYLDLLVNEIGSYNGEVLLPDTDPIVLVIHAVGGTWSMSTVVQ